MKERELLELAAKAVGLNFGPTFFGRWGLRVASDHDQGEQYDWNPLSDSGDALSLAVALGLRLDIHPCGTWAMKKDICFLTAKESASGPEAVTRLAIVRAAALVGHKLSMLNR